MNWIINFIINLILLNFLFFILLCFQSLIFSSVLFFCFNSFLLFMTMFFSEKLRKQKVNFRILQININLHNRTQYNYFMFLKLQHLNSSNNLYAVFN